MRRPPGCRCRRPRRNQGGFSLVAAVFLIVVLASLAAFAVQVAMTQYQGASLALLEARAQVAAQAGIEYGANRALQVPTTCRPRTLSWNRGALAGFVVTVTCASTTHAIGTVYALTATATHGTYGQPDYVRRIVTRNVTTAP